MVIFFDIGNTLASAVVSPKGALQQLVAFPFVPEILVRLGSTRVSGRALRLGIISNTGNETATSMRSLLSEANLLDAFEDGLLLFSSVEGMDKSQRDFFDLAAQRAGAPASDCVYVGEDEAEREVARSAGFSVSFHALHVFQVIREATS